MIKRIWDWVDHGVFGYGSAATMGIYRILIGAFACINFAMLLPYFDDFYSEKGYIPLSAVWRWQGQDIRFEPLNGTTNPTILMGCLIAATVAALFTSIGLWTRVSSIALAVLTVALHHRNPIILHGGDTLLRLSVITLALAPCGQYFSVDRWLRDKKGLPAPEPVSKWPRRLVQLEMAIMYVTTVIIKMMGTLWVNGTAAWYPTRLAEFDKLPWPPFLDAPPFLQAFTWGTLIVELAMGTIVFWKPARKWALLGGVLLHATIEWRFNIPLFAFISMAQYVSHYEGEESLAWVERMKRRFGRRRSDLAVVESVDSVVESTEAPLAT